MKKFWKWLWEWFMPTETGTEYFIVEVEKPRDIPADAEVKESITTLQHHPGFVALTTKLRRTEAALSSKLKNQPHENIREVDILQAGIFWAGWLDKQLKAEVFNLKAQKPKAAYTEEIAAFEEAHKAFDIISG